MRPAQAEKPLPVPVELQNAPWNRPEVLSARGVGRSEDGPVDGDVDDLSARVQPLSLSGAGTNAAPEAAVHAIPRSAGTGLAMPDRLPTPESNYASQGNTPFFETTENDALQPFVQAEVRDGPHRAHGRPLAAEGLAHPPDLRGIVDLTNTEDTTVDKRYAPAVVHEVIRPHVHHIREEQITREIHTHDVYHRIQPVVDVQVLPTKHFVPNRDGSGLTEVSADQVPGRALDEHRSRNWVVAETVSRGSAAPPPGPRRFTARTFEGGEGDHREEVGEDGVRRTFTTWVHPPTVSDEPRKQGLTQAVDIP